MSYVSSPRTKLLGSLQDLCQGPALGASAKNEHLFKALNIKVIILHHYKHYGVCLKILFQARPASRANQLNPNHHEPPSP